MRSYNDRTPLHLAVIFNNYNIVEYLIHQKLDVNAIDLYESTPLSYCHN